MPITQPRMITLIDAALDYQNALRRADEFAKEALNAVYSRGADALQELENLSILIDELGLLTKPKVSPLVIQLEQRHFRKASTANTKRKNKQRIARGASPLSKNATAPDSLIQLNSIQDEKSKVAHLRQALEENKLRLIKIEGNLSETDRRAIDKESAEIEEAIQKEEDFLAANPGLRPSGPRTDRSVEQELDDLISGPIAAAPDSSEDSPKE